MKRYIRSDTGYSINSASKLIKFMQDNDVVIGLVERLSDGDTYFEIDTRDEMVDSVRSELISFVAEKYNATVRPSLVDSPKILAYLESEVPEGDYDAIHEDEYYGESDGREYYSGTENNPTEKMLLAKESDDPEVLAQLAHDDFAIVRMAAARRVTDPHIIKELADDPDTSVRENLVSNPAISRNIIEKLASDSDMFVRDQVAYSTDDIEILEQLAKDPEEYVRRTAEDHLDRILNSGY